MQNAPKHPGQHLAEILEQKSIGIPAAARALGVSVAGLYNLVRMKNNVTWPMAQAIARVFGGHPEDWIAMRQRYEQHRAHERATSYKRPDHPGTEISDQLMLMNLTTAEAARRMGVSYARLHNLTSCKTGISAQMALALPRVLGRTPEDWLELQLQHEIKQLRKKKETA